MSLENNHNQLTSGLDLFCLKIKIIKLYSAIPLLHVLLVSILASSELTTGPDVGLSPSLLCIPPVSGGQLWFTPPYILVRSEPLRAMLLVLLLTGLADSFASQTQDLQDNDYVDINEGALVKVEFSKTLRDGLRMLLFSLFSAQSMICVFVRL